jgi:VWFA-related protein
MRACTCSLTSSALTLSLSLIFCPNLSAQTSPTPTPAAAPTVRVFSREVVLDIDVTDAKGNPVHGLTRDNFAVLEENQPMTALSFREHRADQQDATSPAPAPVLPPNTFTNVAPPESVHPLNILLLDSLDTPITTQSRLQKQTIDFVEKMAPGTRVAVFSLSATGQLTMLQGFTSDRELLKKALKSKALSLQIPVLEDTGQDDNNAPAALDMNTTGNNSRGSKTPPPPPQPQPKIDATLECNHAAARVQYTSNAFALIARYVSGMPGRKNLIWYSGGFPERMRDKQGSLCYNAQEDMSSADDLLEHSHVTVYPVDPRALDILAKGDPTSRIVHIQQNEHLYMEALAEQTGGKTFFNNNDLAAAAAQAVVAGSDYYTFTYIPTNQNWDTRHRTISVKVDQPDLTLVYKDGYNAYPPGMTATPGGRPIEKATPLQSAMMRGTLQPTQVIFHVSVAPASATEASLPPGNSASPKMKPPYRRLTLSYNIDLNGIQFDQSPDGAYHGQFEYAVNVYDSGDGNLLNSTAMAAKPTLPPAVYQSMLASGAKLRQDIDIPAKGDYILRIGVHDLTTDRVGAIEIPTSSLTP